MPSALSRQIADALVHAHERQLVHSDLKPANLFICNDQPIKDAGLWIGRGLFPRPGQSSHRRHPRIHVSGTDSGGVSPDRR